ncbi:site-specific integrase, partial [uncultured Sphaerochaeta sp.]|uniref:tyrosine-type recombinase/integrase n=1 Tax=uncultured Sphaerochaeta sp. TaxID=886478 RepID=UPI002623C273
MELWWQGKRHTFASVPVLGKWMPLSSKANAEFLLSVIMGKLKDDAFNPLEFRQHSPVKFYQYADNWLADKKPNIGLSYWRGCRDNIEKHLKPFIGDRYLPLIDKTLLRKLQTSLNGYAPKTRKNIMDTLSAMLRDAYPDYIPHVPTFPGFKGAETIIPPDIQTLELADFWKIWAKIPPEDRYIFMFMILTGCRTSEARAFRKTDIRSDHIMFIKTFDHADQEVPVKGKKPKPGPMTQSLRNLFESIPAHESPLVFVNPRTGGKYSHHMSDIWNDACKAAGYPYIKLYNATRHTYATLLMNSGEFKLEEIMSLLRHTEIKMTQRYAHRKITVLAPKIDNVIWFPGFGDTFGKPLADFGTVPNSLISGEKLAEGAGFEPAVPCGTTVF